MAGNVALKMRNGTIDTVWCLGYRSPASVRALNLDAITRRLRLDFSDIYQRRYEL